MPTDEPTPDADSLATGHQLPLPLGKSTIKAKVTAQDGTTTQTYTVVVRRLPPASVTLVKNTHLSYRNRGVAMGNLTRGEVGQRFTTGSHADGYGLDTVRVRLSDVDFSEGETLTVRVHEFNSSRIHGLGAQAAVLVTPTRLRKNAVNTFSAPSDVVLKPDTKYIVNFHSTGNRVYDAIVSVVRGDAQTGEEGWAIENTHRRRGVTSDDDSSIMIEIKGYDIPDTAVPLLSSAAVNLSSMKLTYDEGLDTSSVPSASAYSVSVNGGAGTSPSEVSIRGRVVTLRLASSVAIGDVVTVTYSPQGADRVSDPEGNAAGPLTDQAGHQQLTGCHRTGADFSCYRSCSFGVDLQRGPRLRVDAFAECLFGLGQRRCWRRAVNGFDQWNDRDPDTHRYRLSRRHRNGELLQTQP